MSEAKDVLVPMGWDESSRYLRALRHPREAASPAVLGQLREAIGDARLRMANNVASEAMVGKKPYEVLEIKEVMRLDQADGTAIFRIVTKEGKSFEVRYPPHLVDAFVGPAEG